MDAEIKAKWVKALRSGEYKQGLCRLHHNNTYCCLGVFCIVAGRQTPDAATQMMSLVEYTETTNANYDFIKEQLGDRHYRLEEMNDREGKSFAEIADYIEANL